MDFSELDTRSAAEQAQFLHLRHPVTLELLHTETGEPCGVMVMGVESASAQQALRQAVKGRLTDEERGLAYVSALCAGFVNVFYDGKAMANTPEDKARFFKLSDSFVQQVTTFAQDRANFFGKASNG